MTCTSAVYATIDTSLKENAKPILSQLDISPSTKPLTLGNMTTTELDEELNKGITSLVNGKGISADDLDSLLNKEFDIWVPNIKLSTPISIR